MPVHAGGNPLGPDVKARLDERAAHRSLTPREIEVLQLVSQGKRNKEIAALLGLSVDTVPVHLKHVFAASFTSSRRGRRGRSPG